MPTDDRSPLTEFPTATVKPTRTARLVQSHLWWVTLVCLGVACYSAWHSLRPAGTEITIHFAEGHGLKAGDTLRHRGIEIGIVTAVELADDLHQVRTTVSVEKSADGIAKEGSRFWVVRPLFSLTSISGLETAVGAKYIAVEPGPVANPRSKDFQGLDAPPPLEMDTEGMKIRLRAAESFGINPSSPVTYRGIKVGQVVSVGLNDDATNVDIVANVEKRYQPLLRESSKFWKTSGVDVDFGIRGFHLSTESLAAIAKGGVSFITPRQRDEGERKSVAPGHVFELFEKLDKDWIDDALPIELPDVATN
jgi:paraquat-inducible protein B